MEACLDLQSRVHSGQSTCLSLSEPNECVTAVTGELTNRKAAYLLSLPLSLLA